MSSVVESAKRAISGFYDRHRLVTRVVLVASAACLFRNVHIAWLYPFLIYAPSPMRAMLRPEQRHLLLAVTIANVAVQEYKSFRTPNAPKANLTYLLGGVFRLDRWLSIAGLYLFVVLGIWAASQTSSEELQRLSLKYEALCLIEPAKAAFQARTRRVAQTPPQNHLSRAVERADRTLVESWKRLIVSPDQDLGHFVREFTIRRRAERRRTARAALRGLYRVLDLELVDRPPFQVRTGYFAWIDAVLDSPFSASLYPPTIRPLRHPVYTRLALFLPFIVPYPLISLEYYIHTLRRILHHPPQDLVDSTISPFFAALCAFINANTALYGHDLWDVDMDVAICLSSGTLQVQAVKAERKLFRAILDEVLATRT